MAILNPTTVTVDAILTTKGRELLARNDGSFQITQFALADDEIDYTMYNPNHPSGSAYYGEALENVPVLEAFPNDSQTMRYKLVTLPRGTSRLPVVNVGYTSITLRQGASLTITPQTLNYLGATSTFEANPASEFNKGYFINYLLHYNISNLSFVILLEGIAEQRPPSFSLHREKHLN